MTLLYDYGFDPSMLPDDAPGIPARITAAHKNRYELISDAGPGAGRVKSSVYYNGGEEAFPTTGDFVLITPPAEGDSQILRTLARKSLFERLDPSSSGHAAQAVAANFDRVFILMSLNDNFNLRRLERYLTLAWP